MMAGTRDHRGPVLTHLEGRWQISCVCGWGCRSRHRWIVELRARAHEIIAGPLT